MTRFTKMFVVTMIVSILFSITPNISMGLDTLYVDPGFDTLPNAIQADLESERDMNTRVYKLHAGQHYLTTQEMQNEGWHLRLVADDVEGKPAIIQPAVDISGAPPNKMLIAKGDVTLINIAFSCIDNTGNLQGRMIDVNADSLHIYAEKCYFELTRYEFWRVNAEMNVIEFKDCIWRNGIRRDKEWNGRGLDTRHNLQDSIMAENCTFIGVRTPFHIGGGGPVIPYFKLNHCTFWGIYGDPVHAEQFYEAHITNNIFANTMLVGVTSEIDQDVKQDTSEGFHSSGFFDLDSCESDIWTDETRKVNILNNNWWLDPSVHEYYENNIVVGDADDTLRVADWIGRHDRQMIDSRPQNFTVQDTLTIDPEFVVVPENLPDWINWMKRYRDPDVPGDSLKDIRWDPEGYVDENGLANITWPIQEDLSYPTSNPQYTASTDGFPLGDLNWFPDKKAEWEEYMTDVKSEKVQQPIQFVLHQNYPNPFNPTTTINYRLKQTGDVYLTIYNVNGQQIRELVNAKQQAGPHAVVWNGLDNQSNAVAGGVYFYRLETGNQLQSKKMVLVK